MVLDFIRYSATKAAVRSFALTWTVDLKQRNICANTLSPGPIGTPGFNDIMDTDKQMELMETRLVASVPMGRMGRPEEIAKAVLFLASDDSSSYVTGVGQTVDGGMAQTQVTLGLQAFDLGCG